MFIRFIVSAALILAVLVGCGESSENKPAGDLSKPAPGMKKGSVESSSGVDQRESEPVVEIWASLSGQLNVPESVIVDPGAKVLYVSNINSLSSEQPWKDNQGFISKLDENGRVVTLHWVTGLKAPKGLALAAKHLIVADLDELVVIDTETGEVVNRFTAPDGVVSLNDVAYDSAKDVIYVTDFFSKKIYQVDFDGGYTLLYDTETESPYQNGLYVDGHLLIMAGQQGKLKSLNLNNEQIVLIAKGLEGSIDGIWKLPSKGYLVSVWEGKVYFVGNDGTVVELFNNEPAKTADISYWPEKDLLLIPDFKDKVLAYKINSL